MRAMVFDGPGLPLRSAELPIPVPTEGQLLLRVLACGVCRTDLHLLDGEVVVHAPPRVLGHQIVGQVIGESSVRIVGVPWLGWTCGACEWCTSGRENLCPAAQFTGCDIDGGFAEFAVADARFCFDLPIDVVPAQAAPLLCAGLIGYRTLEKAGDGARNLGIYGFGAAAHILLQVARWQGRRVYAFTREGDLRAQEFARELGAAWVGASGELPPAPLDAALIFAPVGDLVPAALRAVKPGGIVVCGGIHMSDIPSFPYSLLWQERAITSVANLTRADGVQFLEIAPKVPIETHVTTYRLDEVEQALHDLRAGTLEGAAVIVPTQ